MHTIVSYGVLGWIALAVFWTLYHCIYILVTLVLARNLGATVEKVSFGYCPTVARWKGDGFEWRLGGLPLGGYVKTDDSYQHLGAMQRIFLALIGPASNIVIGWLVLVSFESRSALFVVLGKLGLYLGGLNLVPSPMLSGGTVAIILVELCRGRELTVSTKETMLKIASIPTFALFVFAIVVAVRS